MITRKDLDSFTEDELSYLYYCCDKEFYKNGYVNFDFDSIKVFPKQCLIDIVQKYSNTLSPERKDLPSKIISRLKNLN